MIITFGIIFQVIQVGDIGVAEAERDAGVREAEYERGCEDKKFQAETSIADSQREFEMMKAGFDQEVCLFVFSCVWFFAKLILFFCALLRCCCFFGWLK